MQATGGRMCRGCAGGVQVLCCTPRRPSNSVAFYSAGVEGRWFIAQEGAVNRLADPENGVIGAMQGNVWNWPYRASRRIAALTLTAALEDREWSASRSGHFIHCYPLNRRSGHQNRCGHFGEEINS